MVKDDTEKGQPKRTRIFKGRSRRKADAPAAPEQPVEMTPVMDAAAEAPAPAEQHAVEPAPDQAPAPETAAPAAEQPEPTAEKPADREPEAAPAADEPAAEQAAESEPEQQPEPEQPAASPFPTLKPASTTSLLFYAPPAEYLAPLPGSGPARSFDDREDDDAEDGGTGTSRRRSRSRRTRGGADGEGRDDQRAERAERISERRQPREPRERRTPEPITEPQRIKGSTRLEAKKQRRRDGRDAGRRRPVVTEAEFLARRESVDRVMVVRSKDARIQIGVLEDGVLVEHYVARSSESSLIGNVYLGRVQNVLPSMEAAFVDIGRGRNAVLYSGEVDWEAAQADGEKNQPRRIELALKPGDRVLVQVTKDPIGHKGARLTSQVSLPGRYLVYVPNGSMSGISRKLPDTERARLKKILKEVLPENVGVIVRTAAEGATEEQLTLDVQRLTSQWAEISRQVEAANSNSPALLHSEPDLLVKIVRDVFNEDFRSMVIQGTDAQQTIESYLRGVAPDLLDRVQKHEGDHDPFDEYRISEQIEKALERKVWLPSGGSLVIDRTEAMTVVDVNTGKFVGSGGNLEETVTKNNLEAAEEIVRQLRLRDIGGIIVVDFIDMVLESNRDLVLRRLVECLSRDRTKHQVAEVTSLGLVQMTRKRLGLGLLETFSENCDVCAGRGVIVHHDPVTKHRGGESNGGGSSRGGGRGGRGGERSGSTGGGQQRGQNGGRTSPSTHTGTHAITEDVSKALASIAAKTVHHDQSAAATTEAPSAAPEQTAPARTSFEQQTPEQVTTAAPAAAATEQGDAPAEQSAPAEQPRSGRGGRRGSRRSQAGTTRADAPAGAATAPSGEQAPATTAGPTADDVAILDIPVPPAARSRQKLDPVDAEQLLGSVLEALPEPPAPGTRKRASRRVSSGTINAAAGEQRS